MSLGIVVNGLDVVVFVELVPVAVASVVVSVCRKRTVEGRSSENISQFILVLAVSAMSSLILSKILALRIRLEDYVPVVFVETGGVHL
jgi:hypothetical protein